MGIFKTRHIKLTPDTLQELMATHDISQSELAEVVGTSQPAVAAMCSGTRNITSKMTTRIYDGLEWYLKPACDSDRQQMADWFAGYEFKHLEHSDD